MRQNRKGIPLSVWLLIGVIIVAVIIGYFAFRQAFTLVVGDEGSYSIQTDSTTIPEGAYIPDDHDLSTIYLRTYHMDLVEEKGLGKGSTFYARYFSLQDLYRKALEQYLKERFQLQQYDQEIQNSPLNIGTLPEGKGDIYQKSSTWGFSYLYLRNNLFIEVLSAEDLSLLEKALDTTGLQVTQDVQDMVLRTYPEVIRVWYPSDQEGEEYTLAYGPGGGEKWASNTALLFEFGIQTVTFDENGNFTSTGEESKARLDFVQTVADAMKAKLSEGLEVPVEVFIER